MGIQGIWSTIFLIDIALSRALIHFAVMNVDTVKFKRSYALEYRWSHWRKWKPSSLVVSVTFIALGGSYSLTNVDNAASWSPSSFSILCMGNFMIFDRSPLSPYFTLNPTDNMRNLWIMRRREYGIWSRKIASWRKTLDLRKLSRYWSLMWVAHVYP